VISKVYLKILVSLRLVQNLEILDLAMAKVEKINIAVTYKKDFKIILRKFRECQARA
jgi:hypothetical protein